MSKKSNLDRHRDAVSSIRINHQAYADIRHELEMAFESVSRSPVPTCLLITGETRTGKSSVVTELLDMYAASPTNDGDSQTVVYAVAPPKATLKSLLEALLKGLGDPFWSRGTESSMTHRLYTQLEKVNCKMIVLDEFQHLCDKGQDKKLKILSDWLKVLVESRQWGLVAVGLPESASIVHTHPQLRARFRPQLKMPLFDWQDKTSRAQFRGMLKGFRNGLKPFEFPLLESDEVGFRIYLATAGRVGLIAALLDRAVTDAIYEGRTKIPMAELQRAYETAIWTAPMFPVAGGPFLAPLEDLTGDNVRLGVLAAACDDAYADDSAAVHVYGNAALQPGDNRGTTVAASQRNTGARRGRSKPSNRPGRTAKQLLQGVL